MNKVLTNLSTLALCLLSMAACTSENSEELSPDDPTSPVNGDTDRREVLMTIKNTLSLTPSGTKAGGPATKAIALAEENHIGMLDVYVFGSATEDGVYTFQERFAYREDPVTFPIPAGATKLDLNFGGVDNNQLNGTLRIKKGLFVKLYGVANNPALGDPSGLIGKSDPFGNGEMYMNDADYKPLTLATPGTTGTAIATAGIPTETEFATFHTFLQDGVNTSDEFVMTGAWTTPLDLTDFSVYARLQAGFKLTRTDARFDIVNNAATSKFTITAVSMGNGRRGANCFPITAYGSTPAAAGDLITYPARTAKFKDGDPDKDPEANAGTVEGAFYCSPSPIADGGYLILEGTYQANLTDPEQNVVYRIPFKQANATGGFTNLEINPNHRYTIGITKADDYHVDFDITVADWEDADDINGFEPTEPIVLPKNTLVINQNIATAYERFMVSKGMDITDYPPFNYDDSQFPSTGADLHGNSDTNTVDGTYYIEVGTDDASYGHYDAIVTSCKDKGDNWRTPTIIELYAIYALCDDGTGNATKTDVISSKFKEDYYYSSSSWQGSAGHRCVISFENGTPTYLSHTAKQSPIRCVRDYTPVP